MRHSKKIIISIIGLTSLTYTACINAATISFTSPTSSPSGITTPFTVKGAGVYGLNKDTIATGTYSIMYDSQGRVINTNLSINNDKESIPQVAPGSFGWSSEGGDKYTLTLSAGGNPGQWDPKQDYCLAVSVNGSKVGSNCTNHQSYWSPTMVHGIKLSSNSKISVNITYKSS